MSSATISTSGDDRQYSIINPGDQVEITVRARVARVYGEDLILDLGSGHLGALPLGDAVDAHAARVALDGGGPR